MMAYIYIYIYIYIYALDKLGQFDSGKRFPPAWGQAIT